MSKTFMNTIFVNPIDLVYVPINWTIQKTCPNYSNRSWFIWHDSNVNTIVQMSKKKENVYQHQILIDISKGLNIH